MTKYLSLVLICIVSNDFGLKEMCNISIILVFIVAPWHVCKTFLLYSAGKGKTSNYAFETALGFANKVLIDLYTAL